MNKKIVILIGILVIFVSGFIIYLQQKEQYIRLADAGGIVADNTDITFTGVTLYKSDIDIDGMRYDLNLEEKQQLVTLVQNAEVVTKAEKRPSGSSIVGKFNFTDNTGNFLSLSLYTTDTNDIYVNFPIGQKASKADFYKMRDNEMYEFLIELAEKTPSS